MMTGDARGHRTRRGDVTFPGRGAAAAGHHDERPCSQAGPPYVPGGPAGAMLRSTAAALLQRHHDERPCSQAGPQPACQPPRRPGLGRTVARRFYSCSCSPARPALAAARRAAAGLLCSLKPQADPFRPSRGRGRGDSARHWCRVYRSDWGAVQGISYNLPDYLRFLRAPCSSYEPISQTVPRRPRPRLRQ